MTNTSGPIWLYLLLTGLVVSISPTAFADDNGGEERTPDDEVVGDDSEPSLESDTERRQREIEEWRQEREHDSQSDDVESDEEGGIDPEELNNEIRRLERRVATLESRGQDEVEASSPIERDSMSKAFWASMSLVSASSLVATLTGNQLGGAMGPVYGVGPSATVAIGVGLDSAEVKFAGGLSVLSAIALPWVINGLSE